ncbi:MAG: site-specific integrase [Burkholderiales bacterium]|jgi:integrase
MAQIRRRKLKDGSVTYEVRVHRAGHPALSKSFRVEGEARDWLHATEHSIGKGERVSPKKSKVLLKTLLVDFEDGYRDRHGKPANDLERNRLRTLNLDLGDYAVAALDHTIVQKYIARLLITEVPVRSNRKTIHPLYKGGVTRTYSASTVRKFFYQLKKCLEWHALKNGYQLDSNLFKSQPVPPSWGGQRERRLEGDEEARLMAAAVLGYSFKAESVNVMKFAIETAMRCQEILLARWMDLNVAGRTLNIPKEHVKTKTFRQVPLSSRALAILKDMENYTDGGKKPVPTDRIFWQWKDSNHMGHHFRRICHRAKVDDLHFHDLRHEATSRFFEKGRLSDMEIMKVTGHTQYSTLQRYVQLRPSALADKMD